MMNVRVELSIFHIHNSPHTTRPWAVVIGSEAPRRLRCTVKTNTHIWMRPQRNWSALETPNYAQELNRHGGASYLPTAPVNVACCLLWLKTVTFTETFKYITGHYHEDIL